MSRQITKENINKIKQWEGKVLFAYDDAEARTPHTPIMPGDRVAGTLTIGYGHTGKDVVPGLKITEEKATQLLDLDLDKFEYVVDNTIKVELTDNQFAALVSFAFNVGSTAFIKSTLVKKLNKGDYASVPTELAKWTKTTINGKKVNSNGLVNRRAAEIGLWATGSFVNSSGSAAVKKVEAPSTLEVVSTVGGIAGPAAGLAMGTGPVQWAFGAVLVIAALLAGAWFVKKYFIDA